MNKCAVKVTDDVKCGGQRSLKLNMTMIHHLLLFVGASCHAHRVCDDVCMLVGGVVCV